MGLEGFCLVEDGVFEVGGVDLGDVGDTGTSETNFVIVAHAHAEFVGLVDVVVLFFHGFVHGSVGEVAIV